MLLVLNQSPLSPIFATVHFPVGAKFVLSGGPLYYTWVSYELCKYRVSHIEMALMNWL